MKHSCDISHETLDDVILGNFLWMGLKLRHNYWHMQAQLITNNAHAQSDSIANFNNPFFLRQSAVIPRDYLGTATEWKILFKELFACDILHIITLGHLSSETNSADHWRIESARHSLAQRLLDDVDRCGTALSRTNGIPPFCRKLCFWRMIL